VNEEPIRGTRGADRATESGGNVAATMEVLDDATGQFLQARPLVREPADIGFRRASRLPAPRHRHRRDRAASKTRASALILGRVHNEYRRIRRSGLKPVRANWRRLGVDLLANASAGRFAEGHAAALRPPAKIDLVIVRRKNRRLLRRPFHACCPAKSCRPPSREFGGKDQRAEGSGAPSSRAAFSLAARRKKRGTRRPQANVLGYPTVFLGLRRRVAASAIPASACEEAPGRRDGGFAESGSRPVRCHRSPPTC